MEKTLRDEFAIAAMQGLLTKYGGYIDDASSPGGCHGLSEDVMDVETLAEYAYTQADAMLREREKKSHEE